MELSRPSAASTFVSFPMADSTGFALSGLGTLTGTWMAWGDTAGPKAAGNPGFRTLSGGFTEIAATAVYTGALATTELPAASPYVMLRFTGGSAATQYLLIKTSSQYANITGINGTAITAPVTAGYMPIDVKQTISLSAPTDNSIEKALARTFMATPYVSATTAQTIDQTVAISAGTDNSIGKLFGRLYHATQYLDAAVSTRSTLAGSQTIDQTTAISAGTDNSIGKCLGRLYQATTYLNAAITSRIALSDTVTLSGPTDNTVDKALARAYMAATNYIDAAVSSRSAPASAQTIDQTTAISGGTDNSIGKCLARMYQATPFTALTIGTVNTLATGAISSGSFSANAIDAASVDVTTGSEFADAFLGRSVRGGASTGRRVYEAIAFLRNRVNLAANTLTVYQTDDLTTEWTATTATEAVTAIVTDINPA